MHKVASSASMKLMGVPVTENDPLGALATDSPTNSLSGSTKSQTTKASDYVEKASSPLSVIFLYYVSKIRSYRKLPVF